MKLFDSHCHYEDAQFDKDRFERLDALKNSEVSCILNCCSDETVFDTVLEIKRRYDFAYASIGIHPHWVTAMKKQDLKRVEELIQLPKVVAVGEMGLDYFFDDPKDLQKEVFVYQLELAKKYHKPVIIHDRDAHEDCFEILRQYKPKGVVHRYGGPVNLIQEAFEWGMYVSFNNDLSYPEWNKPHIDVLMATPLNRMLIETDCPYASPSERRQERCESSDVKNVVRLISKLRNIEEETIAKITYENAMKVYEISH